MARKDIYAQIRQVGILTTIPILLVAGPAVGYFAGSWIDQKTGKEPWFTAVLIVIGCIASGRQVMRLIQMVNRENRGS